MRQPTIRRASQRMESGAPSAAALVVVVAAAGAGAWPIVRKAAAVAISIASQGRGGREVFFAQTCNPLQSLVSV